MPTLFLAEGTAFDSIVELINLFGTDACGKGRRPHRRQPRHGQSQPLLPLARWNG